MKEGLKTSSATQTLPGRVQVATEHNRNGVRIIRYSVEKGKTIVKTTANEQAEVIRREPVVVIAQWQSTSGWLNTRQAHGVHF